MANEVYFAHLTNLNEDRFFDLCDTVEQYESILLAEDDDDEIFQLVELLGKLAESLSNAGDQIYNIKKMANDELQAKLDKIEEFHYSH